MDSLISVEDSHVDLLHEIGVRLATADGFHLRICSSASAMWTANAATVAPSADTDDGRVHQLKSVDGQWQYLAII